jgi:hypothetical protein
MDCYFNKYNLIRNGSNYCCQLPLGLGVSDSAVEVKFSTKFFFFNFTSVALFLCVYLMVMISQNMIF